MINVCSGANGLSNISIKSVARNPVDLSMEGIATIFNKAI